MKVRGDEGDGEGAGSTPARKRATTNARGSRLPEDWQPPPDLAVWAQTERPDLDPTVTIEGFRDYWLSQPGQKGRKVDWDRTFRNWVRNQYPNRGRIIDDRSPAQRNRDRLEAEWRSRSQGGGVA